MFDLVVAMHGCTREQIARSISDVCDANGWSNEVPTRPADRMVRDGRAYWVNKS